VTTDATTGGAEAASQTGEPAAPAPFTPIQAAAAISVSVIALSFLGVQSVLLGAFADQHRLGVIQIDISALVEALTLGAGTGLMSAFAKPRRLHLIVLVAAAVLSGANLATSLASGAAVPVFRAIAGAPEGVLLWVGTALIARAPTPERWAGVFITAITLTQFAVATLVAVWILPTAGGAGGFVFMAVASLAAIPIAFILPDRYGPLPQGDKMLPLPRRGLVALAAIVLMAASANAVGINLVPIAHAAGLALGVAASANAWSLGAQVAGGVLAVALAGRAGYLPVLTLGAMVSLGVYGVYALHDPAWLFIGATTAMGFVVVFANPFFVRMTIDADPSRRTAMQQGAAQFFGGFLGPLFGALVIRATNVHGALALGAVTMVGGISLVGWLHFTHRHVSEPSTAPDFQTLERIPIA
jgi:hypothetical protein